MVGMNRQEHLAWCKERAREHLATGDLSQAVNSMISDLTKHKGTEHYAATLGKEGLTYAMRGDRLQVEQWIEGFN